MPSAAPSSAQANAAAVVRTLRSAGHIAYFAGGCVRDRLLGQTPKDFDVATDAPPDRVRSLFRSTQAVGAAFGVILVRLGGSLIEVATFRSDGAYTDGRRPDAVTFGTAAQDAQRRDFTINGLFYDPEADQISDHVGGRADLEAKVLRAIGDPAARFAEDHLRLLRAVRFAARFGLTIDPATAAAIDAAAALLPRISAERIAEELRRILTPPTRDAGYRLLWRHGLLARVLPDFGPPSPLAAQRSLLLTAVPNRPLSAGLAWLMTLVDLRWQAGGMKHDLLGNLTPGDVPKLVRVARARLKLSNDELEAVADVANWTYAVLSVAMPDDAKLKRFLARKTAADARVLLEALATVGVAVERVAALRPRLDRLSEGDVAPTPLLTGDLLVAAGFAPGPAFKGVLDAVYDAQLNGKLTDAAAALAMARATLASPGPPGVGKLPSVD